MAVYTKLNHAQLERWLEQYDLGELVSFEGIASGIENSNFFMTTSKSRYVLTLFERLSVQQLPYYLNLMQHLAGKGVPCPNPQAMRSGQLLGTLAGKPASIVNCLSGREQPAPDNNHCAQIGQLLANMHLGAADFGWVQANQRDFSWCLGAVRHHHYNFHDYAHVASRSRFSPRTSQSR